MAQRLQQKRSSIAGRRPDASYLEPGELAVNTNATDPGLFFEGNDGSTVKVGPTAMSDNEPLTEVGHGMGEGWYNTSSKQFSLYNASLEEWQTVLSPMYGGSEYLVFVGSQFPNASDSLSNDGAASPFQTLNRAVIEIAKRSILQGRPDSPGQNQYAIVMLPGDNIARNEPGLNLEDFIASHTPFVENQELTPDVLKMFNPPEGGVLLPRGTSIVGLASYKAQLHPTYVPAWTREAYEDGDVELSPATSIVHATGGSLIERITFTDKIGQLEVVRIGGEQGEIAELKTLVPHGLRSLELNSTNDEVVSGDLVTLSYPDTVSRVNKGVESISEGQYWAEPLSEYTLRLLRVEDLSAITRQQLPAAPAPNSDPSDFLSLSLDLKTHHRLSAIKFATEELLDSFYSKIQYAYGDILFGGQVDDAEVIKSEVNIGAVLTEVAVPSVDTTYLVPTTINGCNLNSNYGLCGIKADGSLVSGLKMISSTGFNYRAFNNDPDVYEVYYDQSWISLKEATWRGLGILEENVTDTLALQYMIRNVQLENFRYYNRANIEEDLADLSDGRIDRDSDTRHYSLMSINGGVIQAADQKSTGAAVSFWSIDGGTIWLEGASCFLGDSTFRADGFNGIGQLGGAKENHKGFEVIGIRRPSLVSAQELTNENNLRSIYLNAAIQSATATTVTFDRPINSKVLLPYSLRPGTVLWVKDDVDGSLFRATIATNGLEADNITLNVETTDNTIASVTDLTRLSVPYIRRFQDPRSLDQRSYYLQVDNTAGEHSPPFSGQVLRFAENQGSRVVPLLETGRQLDPGVNGGWNHVFSIHQSKTYDEGNNLNGALNWDQPPEVSGSYYVSLKLGDSISPYLSSVEYSQGSYATLSNRTYSAGQSVADGAVEASPSEEKSSWAVVKRFDYVQPISEAYISSGFDKAADPNAGNYDSEATYLRGAQVFDERYDSSPVLDFDNGDSDLGLTDPGNSAVVNLSLIDPDYSHSRLAMARLLTLLGYNVANVDLMLEPQNWSNRDLPITSFPALDGGGYATSVGNWPVEFCDPSTIQATGVSWRRTGLHNISKGWEKYQTSLINREMRLDSMQTSSFAGRVSIEGRNDLNETLPL